MADAKKPGSPIGEPLYLSVGFLRRPHGVRGEIIMDLHTDFPERMKKGRRMFVGESHTPVTLTSVRPYKTGMLVKFENIDTPEEAGLFRNQWLYVLAKDVPLPPGQHYKHELLGLLVFDDAGKPLGKLVEILETGANDVYVVAGHTGKEILLPAIPPVILDLDVEQRRLTVHLLEGLVDEEK